MVMYQTCTQIPKIPAYTQCNDVSKSYMRWQLSIGFVPAEDQTRLSRRVLMYDLMDKIIDPPLK